MKIGFLFPGYSTQYVGMAKELYDESRIMQEYFEEASNCLPINFIKLCFASSDIELAKIEHAYTAIFLTSVSIAAIIKDVGIQPTLMAGFGIGELSAIACAEGLSFPDGLYLLSKYAELYKEALDNWHVKALLVKNMSAQELQQICENASTSQLFASIAIYLNDGDHVITGHEKVVQQIEEQVVQAGAFVKDYPVESGLYNQLMDPIVVYLKKYLEKVDFKDAVSSIVSAVDGSLYTKKEDIEYYFIKQLHSPLYWDKVLMHYAAVDIIVQMGPGRSFADDLAKLYPDKKIIVLNKPSDVQELQELVKVYKEDK